MKTLYTLGLFSSMDSSGVESIFYGKYEYNMKITEPCFDPSKRLGLMSQVSVET